MHILRRILIWLMGFLCAVSVTMLVYLGTLQMTVLDRDVVKGWLRDGGVYKNNLVPSLIQSGSSTTQKPDQPATTGQFKIPPDIFKLALERTFTPSYVQSQTEGVIDKYYNWMEGKSTHFSFSIIVTDKRDKFITELASASEPYVAKFPACGPTLAADTMCRPANIDPGEYSRQIMTDNISKSDFFTRPLITNTSIESGKVNALSLPSEVPRFISLIKPMMIGLVVLTLLSAGILIWLSPIMERLNTLKRLGKRIYFGQLFTLIISLLLIAAFQLGFFKFQSLLGDQPAVISQTVSDTTKVIAVSVTSTLALLSGIVCAIGLTNWIGIIIWRRITPHPEPESEPEESIPPENIPPTNQ
jgi:hypothetical protein